jgi:hypothetical protein
MGPVESVAVSGAAATVRVAGQAFNIDAVSAIEFRVGDYVVAAADDSQMAVVYHTGLPYVPGVSAVRIKGLVAEVDTATGTLTVGNLTIDYTAHLSADPTLSPSVGDSVEAAGVQPVSTGALVIPASGSALSISTDGERT